MFQYIIGDHTKLVDKAVLVTGANRGIGRGLVEEALSRGAKRVYATTRQSLAHVEGRVTPLTLNVTHEAQIQEAVKNIGRELAAQRREQ
jgi:NAD(P)-dependent dehydrogenase (short-subunit alcohol dehydrogenase family)